MVRRPSRIALFLWALALHSLVVPVGSIEAESSRQRAQRLFRKGRELYNKKSYASALQRFKEAMRLYPSYKIDLSIGYTLEAMGLSTKAAVHYERFLLQSAEKASEEVETQVLAKLKRLRKRLATVTVSTKVRGAVIVINGEVRARTPQRHRLYLPPGSYNLAVKSPKGVIYAKRLELVPGGHFLAKPEEETRTARLAKEPSRPAPVRGVGWVPTAKERPRAKRFYETWWFWTAVGAVVVGTTVGIAVGAQGDDRIPSGDSGTIVLYE